MANKKLKHSAKQEQMLMSEIWDPQIAEDLRRYVMFTFPWGKRGTPLEKFKEPRKWQIEELEQITEHIRLNRLLMEQGKTPEIYQSATSSGRGPGKSALTAWLNMWFMSTVLGSTSITTANTEQQLKSRTWAELGKWHTLAINSHWFDKSTLALRPEPWFESNLKDQLKVDTGYYYAQAQLWSEENPDAFAGVHNMSGMMLIFDEASGIPRPIWTVSEGFFTEPILHRYWFCFSNPRRNTGEFFECFHKMRKYWKRRFIDSRTIEGLDRNKLQSLVDKYGEDSYEARVEVKGQFPIQGERQFISRAVVEAAVDRDHVDDGYAALMMGVDPARYGDDKTVIRWRQGRNGRIIPPTKLSGKDNMEVANICAHLIDKYNPDAVCIDAGNGTGIIDRLREMNYKVYEVWFGGKSDKEEWANKRTEIWDNMRTWLQGACIDDDMELTDDLVGPEYVFQGNTDKIMLEPKEKMKKRGLASPDDADALACTFFVKVSRKDRTAYRSRRVSRQARGIDYNIFSR